MIRVLLADDQPLVRSGIAMLLAAEADIEVVGECADGASAVELAGRERPDVVLMDVRMPGTDGVTATRDITAAQAGVRVLVLTTYHVDDAVRAALLAGASGFLLKDAVPDELTMAVRAVAAGEAWLDPAVTRKLLTEFATLGEHRRPTTGELGRLTDRERQVLVQMAHGLSNAEIAVRLHIGDATVKTHVGRVLMKLGLRDRAQAVAAAYRGGLMPPPG
ncbi:DNA-binding response regulator, NarL/FixJ family, contains REC and HTH domains [Micromonospora phaseoli]|uniref:DNA-binding response regulator, NarL/FixJ family, contains REC and HTH domains n=1 Tax=Micromonospora phaseoli TaxID=1144548 RepID=A0A1H6YEH9_9ACTN|nr:response regulator transcription factor [Micromonospora phaseoli]PZW00002.1 LuxR family two component transcriptional regulator [Micromonospora phaseoli]GIJ80458.1 DNA-binding response regulator [Micromonospora phaseoli]SEJ35592.1 DNA-binding response regulator, NarL/FixJ family, contains REC and HTH domains [Micromonospora phaseoli]